jgi:hypothetical protein
VLAFLVKLLEACLASPVIRNFLELAVIRVATEVISDLFTRTHIDAGFRAEYLALAKELKAAPTAEEKQVVLKKIQALRRG